MRVVTVVASSLGLVIAIACLVNYRGDDAVLSIKHHEVVQEQSAAGGSIVKQTVNNNLMAYYQQQGTKVYRTRKKPVADAAAAFMVSQRRYDQVAPETQFTQELDMDLDAVYPVISSASVSAQVAAMDSMGASTAVQDEQDADVMTGAHKVATKGVSKAADKRKNTKAQISAETKEETAAKAEAKAKVKKAQDAAAAKAKAKLQKRAQAMQSSVQTAEKAALGYITSLHETNNNNIKKTNGKFAADKKNQQALTSTLTKALHHDLETEQSAVAKAKDAVADAQKAGVKTEKSAKEKAAAILAAAKLKSKSAKLKVAKGATSTMLESELRTSESAEEARLKRAKDASLKDEAAIQDQLDAVNNKAKKTEDNASVHALQVDDDNQAKILQAREDLKAVKMQVAAAKRKARQQAKKDLKVQEDDQQRKLNVVKAAAQKAVANAANAKADSKSR